MPAPLAFVIPVTAVVLAAGNEFRLDLDVTRTASDLHAVLLELVIAVLNHVRLGGPLAAVAWVDIGRADHDCAYWSEPFNLEPALS